jgi:alanine-glyoxylate transaminase/serine-glyoxylate transaminase/serine-pyruvate transaminase
MTDPVKFSIPKRLLMGPGPSEVPPDVLAAQAQPTIGHLDPRFIELMDEMRSMLAQLFLTEKGMAFTVSAPGSAGMEMALANLLECGDTAIICRNGVFGTRMAENARRMGAKVVTVDDDWGTPVTPEKLEQALKENPGARLVGFVAAETSTGARSDTQRLASIARDHGAFVVVDAVTALAGTELRFDDWGLDVVYSGSQKCLSCPPGLSPICFSERALERIQTRQTPCQSWFLDVTLLTGYWGGGKRAYHHTAPVNALYGLHQAVSRVLDEGLEACWQRHAFHHQALAAGLSALGLDFVVEADWRLPQLNTIYVPEGVDEAALRKRLLEQDGIEIGAGLGDFAGKALRIGLMGYTAQRENVVAVLTALQSALEAQGQSVANGVDAAEAFYQQKAA